MLSLLRKAESHQEALTGQCHKGSANEHRVWRQGKWKPSVSC